MYSVLAFSCNELLDTQITHTVKDADAKINICTSTPVFLKAVIPRERSFVVAVDGDDGESRAFRSAHRDIEKPARKIMFLCVWPNVYISRI